MPDKEFYLLPAKKDEAASDDGSKNAGEDEEEDDQPVLRITIHPEISVLVSLYPQISLFLGNLEKT